MGRIDTRIDLRRIFRQGQPAEAGRKKNCYETLLHIVTSLIKLISTDTTLYDSKFLLVVVPLRGEMEMRNPKGPVFPSLQSDSPWGIFQRYRRQNGVFNPAL
jgi:hypothetical protein